MSKTRHRIAKHLLPLLSLSGVSGREAPVIRYFMDAAAPFADDLTVDPMGNVFAVKRGRPGPKVMIASHLDEIGLMVKSIQNDGFLRFDKLGGVGDNLLPGRVVTLGGRFGIVGVKAGHLSTEKERSEVKRHTELYIDVGANSKEEVLGMGIGIGTAITFVSPPIFMTDDLLVSKALDNRLGSAIALALFEELSDGDFSGELHLVATVQEEIGLRGAITSSFRVKPDLAIALDTIPSGDTPDINQAKELPVSIGKGPVLQVSSRGFIADGTVTGMLEETAKPEGIPYQTATFMGGNTDAAAIHLSRSGIPSAAVTIPRRYSHSPVEMVNLKDADGTLRLLSSFMRRLPEHISWQLPGETK